MMQRAPQSLVESDNVLFVDDWMTRFSSVMTFVIGFMVSVGVLFEAAFLFVEAFSTNVPKGDAAWEACDPFICEMTIESLVEVGLILLASLTFAFLFFDALDSSVKEEVLPILLGRSGQDELTKTFQRIHAPRITALCELAASCAIIAYIPITASDFIYSGRFSAFYTSLGLGEAALFILSTFRFALAVALNPDPRAEVKGRESFAQDARAFYFLVRICFCATICSIVTCVPVFIKEGKHPYLVAVYATSTFVAIVTNYRAIELCRTLALSNLAETYPPALPSRAQLQECYLHFAGQDHTVIFQEVDGNDDGTDSSGSQVCESLPLLSGRPRRN